MTLREILNALPYLTTEERGRLRFALVRLSPKVIEKPKGKAPRDPATDTKATSNNR